MEFFYDYRVQATGSSKKKVENSNFSGSVKNMQEEQELDHLFLTNLEDIMILRDHYKTMKRL